MEVKPAVKALQVGVKVLLRDSQGHYLVLQRSEAHYPGLGRQWDIPGGRISPGMALPDNLKREVAEETGLRITTSPILLAAQDIIKESVHVVRLTYTALAEGTVSLGPEHTEHRWVSLLDMKGLKELDPYVRQLLDAGLVQV